MTAPVTGCSASTTETLALRRCFNQLPLLPPSSCPNLPPCSTPILSRNTSQATETKHQDTSATRQHPTNPPCAVLVQRTTSEMNSSCVLFDSLSKTKHHDICPKAECKPEDMEGVGGYGRKPHEVAYRCFLCHASALTTAKSPSHRRSPQRCRNTQYRPHSAAPREQQKQDQPVPPCAGHVQGTTSEIHRSNPV